MNFLRGQETVTIVSKTTTGTKDALGKYIMTTSQRTVSNVSIGYNASDTTKTLEEQALSTTATIYFPHGTVIKDNDSFIIYGSKWVKNGIAPQWVPMSSGSFLKPLVPVEIRQNRGNADG